MEIRSSLNGVLDYIPIICILGIIIGFGSYTTLLGALIISIVFLLGKVKTPFIYAIPITLAIAISGANVVLGGKFETLLSLIFISSIITILISLTNICKKTILTVPKSVSNGFITGAIAATIIIITPTIFALKPYSATFLIDFSNMFQVNLNENAICCSFIVLVCYYYLSKLKYKFLPCAFLSTVAGCLINYFYNMNLPAINLGISQLKQVASADFNNIFHLILFGFLISLVLISQTLSSLKTLKIKGIEKKVLFLQGISNLIGSFLGAISGSIAPIPSKKIKSNKKTYLTNIVEIIILLAFVLFFQKIGNFIPICCCSTILIIKAFEVIYQNFRSLKYKNLHSKTIFYVCFLTSIYNINLAIVLCIILTLIINTKESKQNG